MSKLLWLALVSSCLLFAGSLPAEDLVLKGTVGKFPVVMTLTTDEGGVGGSYFYQKHKQDIHLRGELKAGGYQLIAGGFGVPESTLDKFSLHRDGDSVTGSYAGADGKTLPVALQRVPPGTVQDPRPDLKLAFGINPDYEKLRLAGMQVVTGKRETVHGQYEIQWYVEPLSKERMFQLLRGYPTAVMDSINRQLAKNQYRAGLADLSCAGDGAEPSVITIRLMNDRFVSYSTYSTWDCDGAAHPDEATEGASFDARTGKALTLDDVWWRGKGPKPAEDSDAWFKYRREVFAPAVVKQFAQWYPEQMQEGSSYADPDIWNMPAWYLTDRGLYLVPAFSHIDSGLGENLDWPVVPYRVLRKANPVLFEN